MFSISGKALKTSLVLLMGIVSLSLPTQPVTGASPSHSDSHVPIDSLLTEVDAWVHADTVRIMAYIDSCNTATDKLLRRSKYWKASSGKLEALLGIDYVGMEYGSPQPDNTGRIYFLMRMTGETDALFYVDRPMGWPHQLTPNSWADRGIDIWHFWAHPSGEYILVYTHVHGDEYHDIYLFDRDGTYRPLLVDRTVSYRNIMFGDGNDVYLISDDREQLRLLKLDVQTGDTTFMYTEQEMFGILDYYNGQLLCSRAYSFTTSQLFLLDVKTKVINEISGKTNLRGADFTKDGKILALTSELSSPQEYFKFVLYDPQHPGKPTLVYDPVMGTDYGVFLRNQGIMVVNLNMDGLSQLVAFDTNGKPVPVPTLPVGVVEVLRANGTGDIAFTLSSPQIPPTPFAFHIGDTTLTPIGSVATFGFDFSHIDVEVVHYTSTDGTRIPALLYAPRGAQRNGKNPAVVYYHGGPPSQSRPYFARNMAYAMEMGLIMLFPNVRGSEGYTPAYEAADDGEGRIQALQDCERALDYLVEEGWSSPEGIAIWGASYGGYVVNWLSVTCPEKFSCAVSEVGIADLDFKALHSPEAFLKGWEREMGAVGSELSRRLSPIYLADKVTRPIMITAGFHDRRVPAAGPRRWSWLLGTLGKDVLYYETVEAGHGPTRKSQVIDDLTRQYVFTLDHILPSLP